MGTVKEIIVEKQKEDAMKSILGFGISEKPESSNIDITPSDSVQVVRSLVSVRFIGDGRAFTYYNDKFALEEGDYVFVSGKLAGKLGVVESVSTKFKINLADYQRVISKASGSIHGTYESILDKMVSYNLDALSPDEFRTWVMPPKGWDKKEDDPEDEIIIGDGYELHLPELEAADEVSPAVLQRAVEYCREGNVAYLCVRDGVGTAFINGTTWYEVNFRLEGDTMTEMYCDCPYPGLCKHLLAVALTVRALVMKGKLQPDEDFVAIDSNRFWNMVARTTKKVTL